MQDYDVQRRRAAVFTLGQILTNPETNLQAESIIKGLESVVFNDEEHSEIRRMAITVLEKAEMAISAEDLEIEPISITCKADFYIQGIDPHIHTYAGNCVYEDEFQGGDGFYEIYESLRKLLNQD